MNLAQNHQAREGPPKGRSPHTGPVAMTPTQAGLIIESQLSDRPALNIVQITARFDGAAPDADAMLGAWRAMAARHDTLRLSMQMLDPAGPHQRAVPEIEVDFARLDLAGPEDTALEDWLEADRRQGVRIEHAPAWRVRLISLGKGDARDAGGEGDKRNEGRAVMVVTFHHALLDGGGYRLLLHEFFTAYAALRKGHEPRFDAPAPAFLDHCAALSELDHAPGLEYFRQHLSGFDTPNRLDPVFAASGEADPDCRRIISHRLEPAESAALRTRAAALGGTPAVVIAAAWGLVLARCSGRDEAVFGLTRSGRFLLPEGRQMAGCCINTLPCRVQLRGQTLRGLVSGLRGYMLDTRAFEQTPLTAIAGVSDVPQQTALFDSFVMFDRGSLPQQMRALLPGFPDCDIDDRMSMATALSLAAYDDPGMLLRLEYDPSRISEQGAARLAGYLVTVLRAIADPATPENAPLARLAMLPAAERRDLVALSRPAHPVGHAPPVIDLFEAAARAHPGRVAVEHVGPGGSTTYAGLDASANHLAHRLRAAGIGPGDIVGLALPRGVDYIVAMLAVLKAEGCFLPLDPAYPPGLLQDMIDRSQAVMLLTTGGGADHLGQQAIPVLELDRLPPDTGDARALPRGDHDPGRPAYVIFTSGSTGQPKGVEVPQRAIAHHAQAILKEFELTPEDRVVQFTSLNFDISIEEILPTLLAGARLVLRSDEMAQSVPGFLAAMQAHGITVANLPTAFWHVVCAHFEDGADPPALPLLRLLVVGGERPSPQVARRWREMYPQTRLLNGYGPTETTITATLHDVADAPLDGSDLPIGRPTGGALAYVMAPDGSLAPQGVRGELWIGGPMVALGYLHRPDLSAPVFVDDPVLGPPARAYRSGDNVSWRGDGLLSFHGRIDRQIKLRGFRIELGAIEAALERDPQVAAAVVGVDTPASGHARLIAWIMPREGTPPSEAALTRALSGHLPSYMLPQLVCVDHFPQTPGGKIDMSRLPLPQDRPAQEAELPADADTARVQAAFCKLLGLGSVGPDQSFFELGGNSLLSVRLMSLIERDFGQRLSLAALYRHATPREIAAELKRGGDGAQDCLVPIQPEGTRPPLYAVHILGPKSSFFRPLARRLSPDQPLLGLTINLLDPASPGSLPEIAALYAETIRRHSPQGPVRLIAVSQGSYVAYEVAQQLIAGGREVAGLYLVDAEGPGGRPLSHEHRSFGYYASRLRKNFLGVLSGRLTLLQREIGFRVVRLYLRMRRMAGVDNRTLAHSVSAHQAAIDLAIAAYEPQPYPGEITVFRATAPDRDTPEGLASGLGWGGCAPGRVRLIDTGGDHLSILKEPFVTDFAARLAALLERGECPGLDAGAKPAPCPPDDPGTPL